MLLAFADLLEDPDAPASTDVEGVATLCRELLQRHRIGPSADTASAAPSGEVSLTVCGSHGCASKYLPQVSHARGDDRHAGRHREPVGTVRIVPPLGLLAREEAGVGKAE